MLFLIAANGTEERRSSELPADTDENPPNEKNNAQHHDARGHVPYRARYTTMLLPSRAGFWNRTIAIGMPNNVKSISVGLVLTIEHTSKTPNLTAKMTTCSRSGTEVHRKKQLVAISLCNNNSNNNNNKHSLSATVDENAAPCSTGQENSRRI